MKASELFRECAWSTKYEEAGESVNYMFDDRHDGSLIIYFEATNSRIDWLHNFMFKKRPYKDMSIPYKVHRGFLKCWKTVEDIVIEKITQKENGCFKYTDISIVGYSHGGALAQFCHECVWFHRPDLRNSLHLVTYAFESPRIFGARKVPDNLKERWTNCLLFRVNNDIVTHLPPKLFGFCDVNAICKLEGDVSIIKNHLPKCFKAHYPLVVYNALRKLEEKLYD